MWRAPHHQSLKSDSCTSTFLESISKIYRMGSAVLGLYMERDMIPTLIQTVTSKVVLSMRVGNGFGVVYHHRC